jgi:hypothetical protein
MKLKDRIQELEREIQCLECKSFGNAAPKVPPLALFWIISIERDRSITLIWDTSNSNIPISHYEVSMNGSPWIAFLPLLNNQWTVDNLTNGVEYSFKVRAVNEFGVGLEVETKSTPDPIGSMYMTIHTISTNSNNELLGNQFYRLPSGNYGPYQPPTFPQNTYIGLAPDSAPTSGTMTTGEFRIIKFNYQYTG